MLDKQRFIEIMVGLCDLYGKTPSEFIYDTYYGVFKDYTEKEFSSAITKCIKNRKYNSLPNPAEILEYLEGTSDDKAMMAWLQLKEAVCKGGFNKSVEFADPIIAKALDNLGGWEWFCNSSIEEEPFNQKRFMDIYRLLDKSGLPIENKRLVGFIGGKNNTKPENILRIGFNDKQIKGRDDERDKV